MLMRKKLFQNLKYFLESIVPVCEEYDVKLAIHPDDPPWSVFKLPRIVTDKENLDRIINLVDSPYNGLTLCSGSLGANLKNNLPEMIRYFGSKGRIHFAHIRNIKVEKQGVFYETSHLSSDGSLDMFEIVKAYYDIGFDDIGDSKSWTGDPLAQANLYGFGRLGWNPELSAQEIAEEWVKLTFGHDKQVVDTIVSMLMASRNIYEKYTAPLGIGWMVNPGHHYGPNVDGNEYSHWGTYHYADWQGIGVDRTVATGTGYTAQYREPVASMYENIETCPDELLLFFHHVPYTHKLKSGKTVIQHIYDTHFEGAEEAEGLKKKWLTLKGKVDDEIFDLVLERLEMQIKNAIEWRDVVNTYFYRKTGIDDIHGRKIYK